MLAVQRSAVRTAVDEQGLREGLDRVAVLVQRPNQDFDETLARSRPRYPRFEHLDFYAQFVAGPYRPRPEQFAATPDNAPGRPEIADQAQLHRQRRGVPAACRQPLE